MITKLFTLAFIYSSLAWAGGGSIIGNGAGIVENNFQYAYQNLSLTVSECIDQLKCEMNPSEIKVLKTILQVLQVNKSNEKRLQFVSEKDYPGFFDTGEGEVHRIAKTGLTPDIPIYVNLDLLYTAEGKPAFDYSTIVSILTHELGHQAGEENHAKLDILGAKLKRISLEKVRSHSAQVGNEMVEVTVLNQSYPFLVSDLSISWQGVGLALLTKDLMKRVSCNHPKDTVAGVEIDNGHFISLSEGNPHQEAFIGFGLWIHLSCYSADAGRFQNETKSITMEISRSLILTVTEIKKF